MYILVGGPRISTARHHPAHGPTMLLLMLCSLITLAALSTATAARSTTASTATTDVTSRPKLRVTVTSTAGLQCGSAAMARISSWAMRGRLPAA